VKDYLETLSGKKIIGNTNHDIFNINLCDALKDFPKRITRCFPDTVSVFTSLRGKFGIGFALLSFRPSLRSSGQSSWLQIRRSRVRFPGTTGEKKVMGLERGPLSLVSTTEEEIIAAPV
jgi:hypothetical protein